MKAQASRQQITNNNEHIMWGPGMADYHRSGTNHEDGHVRMRGLGLRQNLQFTAVLRPLMAGFYGEYGRKSRIVYGR